MVNRVRGGGFVGDKDYEDKKMKGELKGGDRVQGKFVVVVGEDEVGKEVVKVKNMESG
ncbi:His/Gly/Thr/Pro-type tRNA ligase C-terminal domain-containing protein, partial [Priestia megaterium]|uniref:His/Gly/Thr/Pro-type tRNA ligase C-terminal domain-containing protein n=1 Tax=Priestia megaterium TaxID=1404 RepID=UPI0021BFB56C